MSNKKRCFCNVRQYAFKPWWYTCRSTDVKIARKQTKMIWHAGAWVWKTQIVQFSLSCLFSFFLSFTSFSLCVWSSLVLLFSVLTLSCFHPIWHSCLFFFLLIVCKTAGQYRGVSYPFADNFPNVFPPCPLPSLDPSAFLLFSCSPLGSLALRLYQCLRERRSLSPNNGLLENKDSNA